MGKYTYKRVEHLSDIDLTGATEYYVFEEGLGHKEWQLEDFIDTSPRIMLSMIEDRVLYTREEKPWHECIPEHGVLCWVNGYGLRRILKSYNKRSGFQPNGLWIEMYDCAECEYDTYTLESCTPLTNEEIKQFLREED